MGGGSFGTVYKTKRLSDGKFVAVKMYSVKELYNNPDLNLEMARDLIKNEIKTMRMASKQNVDSIVNLHEVYEQKSLVLLVMDLLEGQKLSSAIKYGDKFSEKQVCFMMDQLTKALDHLRSLNVVHRDIKPSNIIFKYKNKPVEENQLVICDFGFATKIYKNKEKIIFVCGTPGYIAPEIIKGLEIEKSSRNSILSVAMDVYAMGIVLYKLLARESPWKNVKNSELSTLLHIDLSKKNRKLKDISPGFREILKKMLEEIPQNRITAQGLLENLLNLEKMFNVYNSISLIGTNESNSGRSLKKNMNESNSGRSIKKNMNDSNSSKSVKKILHERNPSRYLKKNQNDDNL